MSVFRRLSLAKFMVVISTCAIIVCVILPVRYIIKFSSFFPRGIWFETDRKKHASRVWSLKRIRIWTINALGKPNQLTNRNNNAHQKNLRRQLTTTLLPHPHIRMMKSRTKSPGSPGSNGSTGLSSPGPICPLRGLGGVGGGAAAGSEDSKAYPSISAAYWLPAPTPTPYHVPG